MLIAASNLLGNNHRDCIYVHILERLHPIDSHGIFKPPYKSSSTYFDQSIVFQT